MFGFSKKIAIGGCAALITILLLIMICVVLLVPGVQNAKFVSSSRLGKFDKAAVASNGEGCSEIGNEILLKNGSAVDAAIATLLCEGISSFQSMGLGGGFFMTIWDAKNKTAVFLDARETAPAKATKDMFVGNASAARYGGKAVAIPGELKGYWEAHQRYGKLPWKDLFTSTIKLCETGALVNPYIASALKSRLSLIMAEPSLREIFIDPKTNSTWTTGDRIKRPKLKETLELIANSNGSDIFYNGQIGEELVEDIQKFGGIIEMEDLKNYRVEWKIPTSSKIGDYTVYSSALPGTGIVLTLILNIFEGFNSTPENPIFWQQLVEAFKWAYAKRTGLGDDKFNSGPYFEELVKNFTSKEYAKEIHNKIRNDWTSNDPRYYDAYRQPPQDSGTAHICVLDAEGSAVSVTSTINQILGAMIRSPSTGIILNDEMEDFTIPEIISEFNLPPTAANFIEPGKRPLSSMVPTIVVDDKNEVQLVIGGAGGQKITTSVAITMILNLWLGYNIKEAVDTQRLHHQLLPMKVDAERNFSTAVLTYLHSINHTIDHYLGLGSSITAISRVNHPGITANADYRRFGSVAGF